jgi:hypothetical protein
MDLTKFNALERDVWNTCLKHGQDYSDGVKGFMEDLNRGGCQSGLVGSMCYYSDTVKFYDDYEEEIWDLLADEAAQYGYTPAYFISTFNGADNVNNGSQFKNLLAWWAFEETAYLMYGRWENSEEEMEDD